MKDIKGYEGLYAITGDGRVWSYKRKMFMRDRIEKTGYNRVILSKGGVPKNFLVHRLVNIAFNDNPDNKPDTNHIDGDKLNNHYTNLEWVTHKENAVHAERMGLMLHVNSNKNGKLSGEGNGRSKLTELQVAEIRERSLTRESGYPLWDEYNITRHQYDGIINGTSWLHTMGDFKPVKIYRYINSDKNPNSKLTWDDVREIRRLAPMRKRGERLWDRFNITSTNYYDIINNKTWRDDLFP